MKLQGQILAIKQKISNKTGKPYRMMACVMQDGSDVVAFNDIYVDDKFQAQPGAGIFDLRIEPNDDGRPELRINSFQSAQAAR